MKLLYQPIRPLHRSRSRTNSLSAHDYFLWALLLALVAGALTAAAVWDAQRGRGPRPVTVIFICPPRPAADPAPSPVITLKLPEYNAAANSYSTKKFEFPDHFDAVPSKSPDRF